MVDTLKRTWQYEIEFETRVDRAMRSVDRGDFTRDAATGEQVNLPYEDWPHPIGVCCSTTTYHNNIYKCSDQIYLN